MWFDPNKTNDYYLFKKCFENVQFYTTYDLNAIINFFKKESISDSDWIVVTTGTKGKELIENLVENNSIKSFFIYCHNTKLHESWAKNIKKVGCITSNPEILCQKFIDINNSYYIPNFNYNNKEKNNNILSIENKNFGEIRAYSSSISLKEIFEREKNSRMEKYNNVCIKILHYLDDEFYNDFKETNFEGDNPLISTLNLLKNNELAFQLHINNLKNLPLISLYFSKYPYLYNLLTFEEIKDLFKKEVTFEILIGLQFSIFPILEKLRKKIMDNECILDQKDELREIQIYIIYNISLGLKMSNQFSDFFTKYYQILNFFRDIDFCLKILVWTQFSFLNTKEFNFIDRLIFSLTISEPRFMIYLNYLVSEISNENNFTEEENKTIIDTLTIKDFIIIGDKKFHEKIKTIKKI